MFFPLSQTRLNPLRAVPIRRTVSKTIQTPAKLSSLTISLCPAITTIYCLGFTACFNTLALRPGWRLIISQSIGQKQGVRSSFVKVSILKIFFQCFQFTSKSVCKSHLSFDVLCSITTIYCLGFTACFNTLVLRPGWRLIISHGLGQKQGACYHFFKVSILKIFSRCFQFTCKSVCKSHLSFDHPTRAVHLTTGSHTFQWWETVVRRLVHPKRVNQRRGAGWFSHYWSLIFSQSTRKILISSEFSHFRSSGTIGSQIKKGVT